LSQSRKAAIDPDQGCVTARLTVIWRNRDRRCDALKEDMRPLLHPMLINGRTGDPALYIETLF